MSGKTGFWAIAQREPQKTAAGRAICFQELDGRVNRLSNGLRSLELQYCDGIAMLMHNDPS